MEEPRVTIPIVFCFDANYARYAAVATYSLYKSSVSIMKVYWITLVSDVQRARVLQNQLKQINISILIVDDEQFSAWRTSGHLKTSAYLRLLIPTLISEKRVIYVDSDTLILSDLAQLYYTDMKGCAIAGVPDPIGASHSRVPRDPSDVYINSGVLLLDLNALKSDNFLEKCEKIHFEQNHAATFCDQCIINKYAENRKILVDTSWNNQIYIPGTTQSGWDRIITENAAKILHFVGPLKPWSPDCPSYVSDYWRGYATKLAAAFNNSR